LAKAAATAETENKKTKGLSNPSAKWLHCGWSATQQQHSETYKANEDFLSLKTGWQNCGWSETQQQHSKHNTKRTMILYDVKTYEFEPKRRICRIFGNDHKNEEYITATLWLERRFNNDTEVRNRRKKLS
jgi:hypothetical protein